MNAQNFYEHIMFLGDSAIASNYLSFARKKAKELYKLAKSINANNFSQTYKPTDEVLVTIKITGEHVKLIIEGKKTKQDIYFVNGISRYDENKNKSLKEFIYKDSSSFINLQGHGISPASFISSLGYTTGNNTQHKFIKGSKYTGVMKHLMQNSLSQNKQIGYNFSWETTDGAIINLVRTKKELVNNTYNAEVFQDMIMNIVRISKDGVFINTANYIINPSITYNKDNLGFCGKANATDLNNKYYQQYLNIDCVLENSKFNTTTQTQLLSATDMLPFYSKQGFFKSCGWLFLNNPYKTEITNTDVDKYDIKTTHLMFNTCYDTTKSYLYAIELVVNGKYDKNAQEYYQATYTAKLHLVMEGKLSSLQPWIFGNSGLYMPNESQDKVELFSKVYSENITDQFDFAPVFCVEKREDALSDFTSDDFFFNQPINGYTGNDIPDNNDLYYVKVPKEKPTQIYSNCNIKVVGLMDIITKDIRVDWVYENQQDQYPDLLEPVVSPYFNNSIKNVIVDTHKNLLTNNCTLDFPIVFDGTNVDILNYGGYTLTQPQLIKNNKVYYANAGLFINGIGNWSKNDQFVKSIIKKTQVNTYVQENITTYKTEMDIYKGVNFQEKIIIPMDDRNTIISLYTHSTYNGQANPLSCYIDFPLRNDESYLSSQGIYNYSFSVTDFINTFVTKEYFYIYPSVYFTKDLSSNIPVVKYNIFNTSTGADYFSTKINNYIKQNTIYIGISMVLDVYGRKFVYNVEDDVNTINYIDNYPVFNNYKGITFIGKP